MARCWLIERGCGSSSYKAARKQKGAARGVPQGSEEREVAAGGGAGKEEARWGLGSEARLGGARWEGGQVGLAGVWGPRWKEHRLAPTLEPLISQAGNGDCKLSLSIHSRSTRNLTWQILFR